MRTASRAVLTLVLALSAVGCAGASETTSTLAGEPSTTQTSPTETTGEVGSGSTTTIAPGVTTTSAGGGVPEIDLVPSSELPQGIPVPVPAGGTEGSLSVFGYDSYSAVYPGSMFDAVVGFYDAWFASEGLEVEPEFGSGGERRWRVTSLDLDVTATPGDGEFDILISWPS